MSDNRKNKKGGSQFAAYPSNYTALPTRFPSSCAKVKGIGCAGTQSNVQAANAKYVSYGKGKSCQGGSRKRRKQKGGASVYCSSDKPLIAGLKMGYASVGDCGSYEGPRPLEIPGKFPSSLSGGKKRKTHKKRKSVKRMKKKRSSKRGTKSKTHRGKNYETRKSSKRYRSGKFKKFLRGRKTMLAPDFPFAGGGPTGRSSVVPVGAPVPPTSTPPQTQPYSNIPYTPGYSTGGVLFDNMSALANPTPYSSYNNCPSS